MTDPDTKKRILERRRRFLAAALTGAGVASCTPAQGNPEEPASAAPVVVSVEKPHEDAGPAEEADAGAPIDPPETHPTVCLSDDPIDPEPEPRPCLSIAPTNP